MDTPQPNASAGSTADAGLETPTRGVWTRRIFVLMGTGMIIGAIVAVASVWIPANRIVVFNQPYTTYAKIASVRIARPGFILLYIEDSGGSVAETPYYLRPGYYRNLILPINTDYIVYRPIQSFLFVARLFIDDGDGVFDAQKDTPVNDIFGKLINTKFWVAYGILPSKDLFTTILAHPFTYVAQVLFP